MVRMGYWMNPHIYTSCNELRNMEWSDQVQLSENQRTGVPVTVTACCVGPMQCDPLLRSPIRYACMLNEEVSLYSVLSLEVCSEHTLTYGRHFVSI